MLIESWFLFLTLCMKRNSPPYNSISAFFTLDNPLTANTNYMEHNGLFSPHRGGVAYHRCANAHVLRNQQCRCKRSRSWKSLKILWISLVVNATENALSVFDRPIRSAHLKNSTRTTNSRLLEMWYLPQGSAQVSPKLNLNHRHPAV